MAIRLAVAELIVLTLAGASASWSSAVPTAGRAAGTPAPPPSVATAERPATPTPPAPHPSGRQGAAMAYDPAHSTVVLFGGDAGGRPFDDTWTWDGSRWKVEAPAHHPSARTGAALAFDAQQGKLVLFGGEGPGGLFNDTWTWSGSDWVAASGRAAPPARTSPGLVYDASIGRLVLFGGLGGSAQHLRDAWSWGGLDWSPVSAASEPPIDMPGSAFAYDARAGRVLLADRSQTWALLAGAWSNVGAGLPAACAVLGSVFDALLATPVALCGPDPITVAAWSGHDWPPQPAQAPPPARSSAQVAYDDRTTELVVFGGLSGSAYLDDTWTWTPGRGWAKN